MRLPPLPSLPEASLGYGVCEWIEQNCVIPDGEQAGEPFILPPEQELFIVWFYAINPDGKFLFRRGQIVKPQKWGKGPLSAAIICAEAAGPVLFDHIDSSGMPQGRPWPTPWIQVVAVSEDQTDNVWTALVPMIELGGLKADIPDTGKTRINVSGSFGSSGVIEPVTSAAVSRLGQRLTFAVHDETHSWVKQNGGEKLADVQRRNLAGMGGRSLETTNAWDPSENSVAQATFEANMSDVLIEYPEPLNGSIKNKRERRKVLKHAYSGAPWVDIDRIDAEIEELLPRDPNQAERFFANRIVAGADQAFDSQQFALRAAPREVKPGSLIVAGFDGSRRHDSTGIVATHVESGYQWVHALWERPANVTDDDWEIPAGEVNDAIADLFGTYDVWRLYGDPPYWQTEMDTWAGLYGSEKVVAWWTNRYKAMAYAIKAWHTDWISTDAPLTHDGNEALVRHVGNAVKQLTKMRDDEDGSFLWIVKKDGQKSPRKIDLVLCAVLAWKARSDAIESGALKEKDHGIFAWQ